MRLKCPSCGAQYEVPDDVIPDEGRDVQCSNCGKTWFQRPATASATEATEAAAPKDDVWYPEADEDDMDGPLVNQPAGQDPPPAPTQPKPRRQLDPSVKDILREEADRETRARADRSGGLEDQPDLGLQEPEDEAAKRARQAQDRMRQLRGEGQTVDTAAASAAVAAAPATRPSSRSEMLPDIDEINQTLRASSERREVKSVQATLDEDDVETGGFGRGFIVMMLLFLIAAALYIFAPQLSASLPQVEAPLADYVALVDRGRAWLDTQVVALIEMVAGDPSPEQ